ncbi:unnamed protein product [Soboliphyme baturini]|uniref:Uncharacterized protein n=1 Tax=Soboliphyme baturini TaxID=241478 RepID=A0A183ILP1_9BILA|nr:unnamed protein product [Soboliphyme baturini]
MWYLHLVQFGRNSTDTEHYLEMLRYGARKTSFFASNSTGRSKRRCTRAYYQIIHRLMPFRALQRNSFCSRLDRKEQKSRNVNSKNMRLVMNPTTADRVVDPGATVSPVKMHCSVNSTTTMNTTLILKLAEMHHTVDTLAHVGSDNIAGCMYTFALRPLNPCPFLFYGGEATLARGAFLLFDCRLIRDPLISRIVP